MKSPLSSTLRPDAVATPPGALPALESLRAARTALIPFPREVRWTGLDWMLTDALTVDYSGSQAKALASALDILQQAFATSGISLRTRPVPDDAPAVAGNLRLGVTPGAAPSAAGYRLVTGAAASLEGTDAAGVFHGAQTLRQMLRREPTGPCIQGAEIRDWPAFQVRGFMHDVGRNFQTIESLKDQLDRFAAYKLNAFHWHLTDNPGWRIECRAFPVLNDPQFQTRDAGSFYSYRQIRDLMAYARARHLVVIPELDMPGHSACFELALGFPMASARGMDVLEILIDEFCREIPLGDRPWLHIGSDEVHLPVPPEFMPRMLAAVRRHGSQPVIWNPGQPGDAETVTQLWRDDNLGGGTMSSSAGAPLIDSSRGYAGAHDPLMFVHHQFAHQACERATGDARALGGILCCWADVRVADKVNIFRHNAIWPGVLAFAESIWQGRPGPFRGDSVLPAGGSEEWIRFREFEDRLAVHRDLWFANEPFPFAKFARVPWLVTDPFPRSTGLSPSQDFEPERRLAPDYAWAGGRIGWRETWGGTVMLASAQNAEGLFVGHESATVYALTYIRTPQPGIVRVWIGFETPRRSQRQSGGIPPVGQWDAFGGNVWVNDAAVPAPRWRQPGKYQWLVPTWKLPAHEEPYTDEEFYWAREPACIELRAGWNKVLLRVPRTYGGQNWSFTFLPVRERVPGNRHWIEDEAMEFSLAPAGWMQSG